MNALRLRAPLILRTAAIAIALLAALDPGCVRMRREAPLVSLLAGVTSSDSVRAQAIERALADRFDVVAGWLPAADAVVFTGDRLPEALRHEIPQAPVFALLPSRTTADVRLRALRAPTRARVGERATLETHVSVTAAAGDSLALAVHRDGLLLSRETIALQPGPGEHQHALTVIASDTGTLALELSATLTRSARHAAQTVLLQVHEAPIRVVSHDTRPTWTGTFLRRALTADARFDVTSRTTMSRTDGVPITVSEGAPPSLSSLPAPPALDVVVVGAANALEERDVDALDRWVRSGGSAVLLLDDTPSLRVQRWLDVPGWRRVDQAVPQRAQFTPVVDGASTPRARALADSTGSAAALLGRQWLVPTRVPLGADVWMQLADSSPVVWGHRIGAGTVVVSGALDAWAFREPARSDFARTWPRVAAEAAARVAPAVSMALQPAIAAFGAWRHVEVNTRTAELDSSAATFTLAVGAPRVVSLPLVLHRLGDGRWGAAWRDTSRTTDARQVVLSSLGQPLVAVPMRSATGHVEDAPHPSVLMALAMATNGRVLDTDNVALLGDALNASLTPARRQHPCHPMRSPWWLLPFTGALLAEWWLRRRAGRP